MTTPPAGSLVLVTGATGLIGSALVNALRREGRVVRTLSRAPAGDHAFAWNPERGSIDDRALEGVDAIVHLAGASIAAGRWTAARRRTIRDSRVKGTALLCEAMTMSRHPPKVFVSASAVGFYGDRRDEPVDESSPPGTGFLAEVCIAWEAAAERARAAGIRVAHPRIGLVAAGQGGAVTKMLLPFRLGLGGRVGSGRQWMSWIHIDDLVAVVCRLMDDTTAIGPVNAVTPNPVRNSAFAAALGRILRRPAVMPLPSTAVRLLLGDMGRELLLQGARVLPRRLESMGFAWRYPLLDAALHAALTTRQQATAG